MAAMSRQLIIGSLAMILVAAPARAQDKPHIDFSDEAVARAIAKCKAHLWGQYNAAPGGSPWPDKASTLGNDGRIRYANYGGQTALVMYALLAAGEKPNEARMKRAIQWLSQLDVDGTYVLGIRMQVWTYLPDAIGLPLLRRDCNRLVRSVSRPPKNAASKRFHPGYGAYTYSSTGKPALTGDHSNTHFGVLGVWAAARKASTSPPDTGT